MGEYTPDYFRVEGANARRSATVVVPRLIELIHPLSVLMSVVVPASGSQCLASSE